MRDAIDMLNVMKKSSEGVQVSSKPCDIVYGTVESVEPLKVRVDQKLLLEQEQLKLTRVVMDYEVEMTIEHATEIEDLHTHEYKGKKKFLIHNGLFIGDKVTMIRAHGGQQYLVIDKEVVE